MSNRGNTGNSIRDIFLSSNKGGSFPSPNNPPDPYTVAIIASNCNNNQENTSILTDMGNNPNNTPVETPQGLSGRLLYVSKHGNHYIAFVNDPDGALIDPFQKNNLDTCRIETTGRGTLGPCRVLNLEGCDDVVARV